MVLRLYRHELSHINLSISMIADCLAKPDDLRKKTDAFIIGLHRDLKSASELINYLTNNIGLLSADRRVTDVYKESISLSGLVGKFSSIFRYDLREKEMRIKYSGREEAVISSPAYFEQIMFNLFTNAMKYSFANTNISIINENPKIKVIDYGNVVACDSPYDIYTRGRGYEEYPEGSGIGLYVAKQVSYLINAQILHDCTLVSKYNVPLLKYHKYLSNIETDLLAETNRLKDSGLYYEIINNEIDSSPPPRQMMIDQINKPTYKVVFEVIV